MQRWAQVAADPSPRVRAAAATHGYWAPRFVWAALAEDTDVRVRKAVAQSRWAPAGVLRRLLSDADPDVVAAAQARHPLSRPVRARAAGGADNLGEAMLAAHPRREQWRVLEVTAITLTLGQQHLMAEYAATDLTDRAEARYRVILGLGESETARRLASRWVRWTSTFGLKPHAAVSVPVREQLAQPYHDADPGDPLAAGALALFDAALATLDARHDTEKGRADHDLLTAPWRRACLPTRHTAADAYGPGTRLALTCLRQASQLLARGLDAMLSARLRVDQAAWASARDEAVDSGAAWGYPYRAVSLFWEAVAAAEAAAGASPVDPLYPDALWAAAVTCVFAGRLSPAASNTLLGPWLAAGLPAPGQPPRPGAGPA